MTETKETPAAATTPEAEAAAAPVASTESEAGAEEVAAVTPENGEQQTNGDGAEATGDDKEEDKPEPPKEMRAIVLTGFGGLKGVKVLKKPEPTLQDGEVLIRVKAW